MTTTVSYNCPRCDKAIPREAVYSEIDRRTGRREIIAVCEDCREAFAAQFNPVCGNWIIDGQVETLRDAARLGALAKLDRLRGNQQRHGNARQLSRAAC